MRQRTVTTCLWCKNQFWSLSHAERHTLSELNFSDAQIQKMESGKRCYDCSFREHSMVSLYDGWSRNNFALCTSKVCGECEHGYEKKHADIVFLTENFQQLSDAQVNIVVELTKETGGNGRCPSCAVTAVLEAADKCSSCDKDVTQSRKLSRDIVALKCSAYPALRHTSKSEMFHLMSAEIDARCFSCAAWKLNEVVIV